ncbi:MAG: copper chaperone PCu(A)C [Caldilineales bacterium]|nr:copper chaperone PCu(A)C [Caldilineales bacterium]
MRQTLLVFLLLLWPVLVGCAGGQGPAITVENPWVRATMMADGNSAAYMVLKNGGHEADALIGAITDVTATVELHDMVMEGDVMKMRPVAGQRIPIPARGQVELKPGGLHIMLIGLKQKLDPGATVDLTLRFEKAGEVRVKAEVRAAEGLGDTHMEHGGY